MSDKQDTIKSVVGKGSVSLNICFDDPMLASSLWGGFLRLEDTSETHWAIDSFELDTVWLRDEETRSYEVRVTLDAVPTEVMQELLGVLLSHIYKSA